MRSKKLYSCTVVIFLLIGFACSRSNVSEDSFRFVFMTDIHVQTELKGDEGFKQAIAAVNSLKPAPDFVITGGDLVFDVLKQNYERADSLYTLYSELCENFDMPVYNGIGNHEIFGIFKSSGVDPGHPEFAKKMFENRLGSGMTYRSFDHKGWHFILLDDLGMDDRGYLGHIDAEQLQWLEDDLEKLSADVPVVVVLHIPLVSVSAQLENGSTTPLPRSWAVNNSRELLELFQQKRLRLVLQGHMHVLEEMIVKDMHFITGGSVSGEWWKGPYKGFDEGFVVVDVKEDDFEWQYKTYGWNAESD